MNIVRLAIAFVIAFCALGGTSARADVPVPPLTARITDETGTLTDEQRATLEQTLKAFEARRGTQVSVLIIPTTEPESIEQFSMRVVEQWKLGRKKVDDGALLIVAKNDRALRIEVGYGLEGVLTDATSNRIINEVIVPRFREGNFYGGISSGLDSIMRVANGESLPPPQRSRHESGGAGRLLPVLFLLTVMAGGLLRAVFGRLPGALVTGGVVGTLAWILSGALFVAVAAALMALIFTLLGGGPGLGAGRFIGGRYGGFGRDSHQDIFRGGGGGFGGGGASGRW
ncbi:TPM domain-containing protein [Burkholderia ubonensis]|uniref:TPM domain-containing protein n=1 Tax=Burkholderia ubonensis TaxID=101571 RepID=UPI000F58E7B0|nr:YgcG family protein [Burkholderia ubonensis]RQP27735.1 YgcG family protein [Burkholderia ubonensis]RQP29751.1 YgcG family protein [Burkholderia ubonensis]RQP31907.1 YgcG family protein [Burkholderia ubonensis]RQP47850.1 YgcG family protein [Burkholderia ubonensis]RQP50867.1 YgcG family protein [Burkholderia ubonensis]